MHPKDDPNARREIYAAIAEVIQEADDVLRRRSRNGQWVFPIGYDQQVGDNYGLIRVARNQVLDPLQAGITEARRVLDRHRRGSADGIGITWHP